METKLTKTLMKEFSDDLRKTGTGGLMAGFIGSFIPKGDTPDYYQTIMLLTFFSAMIWLSGMFIRYLEIKMPKENEDKNKEEL